MWQICGGGAVSMSQARCDCIVTKANGRIANTSYHGGDVGRAPKGLERGG